MRTLWVILAALGLMALALTHLGRWVPLGDAAAVIRPHVLVLSAPVIVGLWLARLRPTMWLVVAAVSASGVSTWRDLSGRWDVDARSDFVLYQKNLLWNVVSIDAVAQDILQSGADIVTLQEVSALNEELLQILAETHPHHRTCLSAGNGGIAILSRFPMEASPIDCTSGEGLILARVALPDKRLVWVGAVHLNWPYPFDQARQLPSVVAGLSSLDGDVIVAGDFNMVPWGSSVRQIAEAARGERVGGYYSTFPGFGPFAPLAIDHVIIPDRARGWVDVRPRYGSDHHGLLAEFSLPAS